MVIVRLMGGLGNQMFQYAAGRALAHAHGCSLKLDAAEFENGHANGRSLRLQHFQINASVISAGEVDAFKNSAASGPNRLLNRLRPYFRQPLIEESRFTFDPNILRAPSNVYLKGYWQSEKYFKRIEVLLRREFQVKRPLSGLNQTLAESIISDSTTVSVHIRRGDYAGDPAINRLHGTCPVEYYHQAETRIVSLGIRPHFYVFSDDSSWAQQNLRLASPTTFVAHNRADDDYEDFRLMTLCHHHIIANSSFSWWGAWLNQNPNKIVIAPRKWFNAAAHDTRDLIPSSWLQL